MKQKKTNASRRRFLVVDDEIMFRALLKRMLAEFGDCEFASQGQEALEMFKQACDHQTPYDAIFLDIEMPKLNGKETLRHMRAHEEACHIPVEKRAKVFMATVCSDPEHITESFLAQCDGYLIKPLRRNHVIEQLDQHGLLKPPPKKKTPSTKSKHQPA